jgi:hypothetical protein
VTHHIWEAAIYVCVCSCLYCAFGR